MRPKQRELLKHIEAMTIDGVPPTYEQLRVAMGYASKSTIHYLMHGLAERGIVSLTPMKRNSVAVRNQHAEAIPFDKMADEVWRLVQNGHGRILPAQIKRALVLAYSGAPA